MGTPFMSEIKIISWNFAPSGWAFCNGQTLPINQNQALFSLLGTTYGGNGQTTFGLPNLQGRYRYIPAPPPAAARTTSSAKRAATRPTR
jgi:microcystin-dependent protein